MDEIISKLESMSKNGGPCHQYVDILEPADTLVLSQDEYPNPLV
jgi:hypothetical protein